MMLKERCLHMLDLDTCHQTDTSLSTITTKKL